MKHMENRFGQVFNQNMVDYMVGNYLKVVEEKYHTNLLHCPNYECVALVWKNKWDALVEDANEKKIKKRGNFAKSWKTRKVNRI